MIYSPATEHEVEVYRTVPERIEIALTCKGGVLERINAESHADSADVGNLLVGMIKQWDALSTINYHDTAEEKVMIWQKKVMNEANCSNCIMDAEYYAVLALENLLLAFRHYITGQDYAVWMQIAAAKMQLADDYDKALPERIKQLIANSFNSFTIANNTDKELS